MAEVYHEETFEAILASATRIRGEIYESATSNIRNAQDKQKKDFDQRHLSNTEIKVGDLLCNNIILLYNNKRKDKKRGKFSSAWLDTYITSEITPKGVTLLKKQNDETLTI